MTLANKITAGRIFAVPAFLILLLHRRYLEALVTGLLIGITDALDGIAARRFKQRTRLGGFLDPLADKMLLLATYGALVHLKHIPSWLLIVIVTKDGAVFLGWVLTYILVGDSNVKTRLLGKWATGSQMILAAFCLLNLAFAAVRAILEPAFPILQWGMVALTILSMLDYLIMGSSHLSRAGQD